jgi:hypothetical protein
VKNHDVTTTSPSAKHLAQRDLHVMEFAACQLAVVDFISSWARLYLAVARATSCSGVSHETGGSITIASESAYILQPRQWSNGIVQLLLAAPPPRLVSSITFGQARRILELSRVGPSRPAESEMMVYLRHPT